MCVLLATDTINFKSKDTTNNSNQTIENITNNSLKFANQTTAKATLFHSDNSKSTIDIKIDNGNIIFTSDVKELTLSNINAKYMYLDMYMNVCSQTLYYINQNNALYKIYIGLMVCQNEFDKEKATESKVINFLGKGSVHHGLDSEHVEYSHNIYIIY